MTDQILHLCGSFLQISETGPVDKIRFYPNLAENSQSSQTKLHQNFFIVKSHFSTKGSVPRYISRIQSLSKVLCWAITSITRICGIPGQSDPRKVTQELITLLTKKIKNRHFL